MMKHLRTKHPLELAALHGDALPDTPIGSQPSSSDKSDSASEQVQPTLHDLVIKRKAYKEGGPKKKQLDDLLVKMIVKDLQPLSVVEDRGFRQFAQGLNPHYELPSRRELARTHLPTLYEEEKRRVQEELGKVKYVALTTDIWTSRQTRGFLTVTAHYISSEWIMKSEVLETARMKKDHTAENIAEELKRVMSAWEIGNKVCCIVTDNGANIVSAVTKVMQVRHLPCFVHTLNLVVKDAIKSTSEVKAVQEKIKAIVSFFHHSVKATDKLGEIQEQNNVHKKKLIMDVDTRWNSTFYMMRRFHEQQEIITTTLCLLGKSHMCLGSGWKYH